MPSHGSVQPLILTARRRPGRRDRRDQNGCAEEPAPRRHVLCLRFRPSVLKLT
jgi:hypothetical protein